MRLLSSTCCGRGVELDGFNDDAKARTFISFCLRSPSIPSNNVNLTNIAIMPGAILSPYKQVPETKADRAYSG